MFSSIAIHRNVKRRRLELFTRYGRWEKRRSTSILAEKLPSKTSPASRGERVGNALATPRQKVHNSPGTWRSNAPSFSFIYRLTAFVLIVKGTVQ